MASDRHVTRSAKADIPIYQPLPPRREPPKKKTQSTRVQNKSTSSGSKISFDASQEARTTVVPLDLQVSSVQIPPLGSNRPSLPVQEDDSGSENATDTPDFKTQAISGDTSTTVTRPSRPLPTPISKATWRTGPEDPDEMFISKHAGPRSLSSPKRSTVNDIPPPTAHPTHPHTTTSCQERVTYITDCGFTIHRQEPASESNHREKQPRENDVLNGRHDGDGDGDQDDNSRNADTLHGKKKRAETGDLEDDSADNLSDNDDPKKAFSDTPSGSNYEADEAERMCQHRERSNYRHRSVTPTMEEQDHEDNLEFQDVPNTPPSSPPRIPTSKKGKGRAVNPNQPLIEQGHVNRTSVEGNEVDIEDEGADRGEEDMEEDDEKATHYSSGPIPKASKKKAYAAHQRFMEELEEIATECNKPVKHFRAMVGVDARPTRRMSPWDVFEKWYPAVVKAKPKDVLPPAWSKHVSAEYRKEMEKLTESLKGEKPTQAQLEEHFKVQFDFVHNTVKDYLTDKHNLKTFSGVISKVTEPFVRMSMNVAEEFGIHIFGFAVETTPKSCSSIAWGGSAEYKYLRETNKTVIETQLHDYEGLFKVAEMRQRGLSCIKSLVNLTRKPGENERDHYRRVISEFMCSDLARIYSERENSPQDESKQKMHWSWTDFAYKEQLRLVGWAKNTPYPKDQFFLKSLKQAPLKSMVKPRMALLERAAGQKDDRTREAPAKPCPTETPKMGLKSVNFSLSNP